MVWNTLEDLVLLQNRMNRLFEDATERRSKAEGGDLERSDFAPPADVYETNEEFVIAADLPGIDRAALEITIDDNRLNIRGTRRLHSQAGSRSERVGGTFHRSFGLPKTIDQNNIRADYKDGVLEVHLPKRKDQKPQRVEIKVS
jgi:HSP20 family protein